MRDGLITPGAMASGVMVTGLTGGSMPRRLMPGRRLLFASGGESSSGRTSPLFRARMVPPHRRMASGRDTPGSVPDPPCPAPVDNLPHPA